MKTRILAAAVLIPVALAILLLLPPFVLVLALSVVCAIGAHELVGAVSGTCPTPSPEASPPEAALPSGAASKPSQRVAVYSIIGAVMIPPVVYMTAVLGISFYTGTLIVFFILMCLFIVDFLLTFKTDKRIRLRQLLIAPVAAIIIPAMLSSLAGLRVMSIAEQSLTVPDGRWLVMIPVVITVLTDSGAYFTGITIGKTKPLPSISPNKTVEGFVGGIATGVAGMLIYGLIMSSATEYTVNFVVLPLYGLLGSVVTEAGDLVFSLIKRKCGIKDYGKLIPGHGGVLDRFDSMCFCAPLVLLLVILLPPLSV